MGEFAMGFLSIASWGKVPIIGRREETSTQPLYRRPLLFLAARRCSTVPECSTAPEDDKPNATSNIGSAREGPNRPTSHSAQRLQNSTVATTVGCRQSRFLQTIQRHLC